jgi:hypothetical protein
VAPIVYGAVGVAHQLSERYVMEKVFEGYRIVLEVDQDWFEAIAKMTDYSEHGELMNWVSTDPITVTREVCDICNVVADELEYIEHDDFMHEEEEDG